MNFSTMFGKAPYFAGHGLTAADIMGVFSLTTMRLFQPADLAPCPNIRACMQRIGDRPAYRHAMTMRDPDFSTMLTRGRASDMTTVGWLSLADSGFRESNIATGCLRSFSSAFKIPSHNA